MKPRYLHTMVRVKDLEKSIAFYCDALGMKLHRRQDYEGGRFTLAFVGYEGDATQLELTHNWDQAQPYQLGTGYGHIAFGVSDIKATFAEFAAKGVNITRPAGAMKHGSTIIGFIKDPDGYLIEFIQKEA